MTYGVIGMLDLMRDPRAEGVAAALPFGVADAPLGDLAALASRSFRNWSLFMVGEPVPFSRPPKGETISSGHCKCWLGFR